GDERDEPINDKLLDHVQFTDSLDADVVLQWSGVTRHHGVVIVNNKILINTGPDTGPIELSNIHFPTQIPPLHSVTITTNGENDQLAAGVSTLTNLPSASSSATANEPVVDAADNSGILSHNQFSDRGLGDIGAQWRNVHVSGSVTVVHNTLSVDVTGENT